MISRTAVSRASQLALRRQSCAFAQQQSRGYAVAGSSTTAPSSAAFESTDIAGVTVVSKDHQGPATKLAIVAKAGTRYQPAPGLTAGLEAFAFKNTLKRSALRITRETELLGGQLTAYHTREALVLETNFLREHLPYFTELLGEVISQTKFNKYELQEDIEPVLHLRQARYTADPVAQALDAAHAVAFHHGLGEALYPSTSTPIGSYLDESFVAAYAAAAYARPSFALVADGASQAGLAKWVEPFFKGVGVAGATPGRTLDTTPSKYYGGQQRLTSSTGNAVVIAFPVGGLNNSADATADVLTALLGGQSNIKWSPGFTLLSKAAASVPGSTLSAKKLAYSDAGLLTIQATGLSAAVVRDGAAAAVKALQSVASGSVSKEDLTKAVAKAKFDALTAQEPGSAAVTAAGTAVLHGQKPFQPAEASKSFESVTADKVKTLAKKLLESKASFAAVGDLHVLPFAEDVGLAA